MPCTTGPARRAQSPQASALNPRFLGGWSKSCIPHPRGLWGSHCKAFCGMEASGMDDETFEDAQEGDHTFLDALVSLPTGLAARSALVDDSEPPTPAAAFAEPLETEAEACESAAEPSADSDLSLPGPAPAPFTEHQNGQHGAVAALARAPSDAAARSTHTSAGQRKARARVGATGVTQLLTHASDNGCHFG